MERPEAGKLAAENIAIGASRAGRKVEDIDVVSLLPMSVAQDHQEALERMRPLVAFYGGFFPRYNRSMAEQGFPEEARAIREAWQKGDRQKAIQLVPDPLIETVSVVGTPTECRERVEAYRHSGIVHPVIFPVSDGPSGKQHVLDAVPGLCALSCGERLKK